MATAGALTSEDTNLSMDTSASSIQCQAALPAALERYPQKYQTSEEDFVRATAQAEVFSFYIDKFDADENERRGDLYGTIEAIDLDGTLELYQQKRQNSESVRANHPISLTGPPRSISVLIGFAVDVDLHLRKDDDGEIMDGDDSKDVEISKWQLSWDVGKHNVAYITRGKFLPHFSSKIDKLSTEDACKIEKAGYDQALKAVFEGQNGCCATMYYTILRFAVQAWVVVDIVHLVSEDSPPLEYDVHGSLLASYGDFDYNSDHGNIKDYCKSTLLKTGELGSVKGVCGKRLQLSRCMMAVPAYSSLVIEADLWYNGVNGRRSIAKGEVKFTPGMGYAVDYIAGDDDIGIKVVVGWTCKSEVRQGDPLF